MLLLIRAILPRVELSAAPRLRFTGDADSNSPALWQRVGGWNQVLVARADVNGRPSESVIGSASASSE